MIALINQILVFGRITINPLILLTMPGAKIQANNPANDPNLKPIKGYSKFQPNMSLYKTHTFGLIEPHFAFDVVPDDKKVQYRSGTDLDTQNLKAPLMTPMRVMKDTFFVPIRALMPHNADLLVTNPLTGQDIDPQQVNTLIRLNSTSGNNTFGDAINSISHRWWRTVAGYTGNSGTTGFTDSDVFFAQLLESSLLSYQILSPILSYGSLAQSLGYNFAFGYTGLRHDNGDRLDFDQTFDILMNFLRAHVKSCYITLGVPNITAVNAAPTIDRQTLLVRFDVDHNNLENVNQYYCFRAILELIAQGYVPEAVSDLVLINPADTTVYFSDITNGYSRQTSSSSFVWWSRYNEQISGVSQVGEQININRLIGYQLLCASFYTDDAVDYVYTAKLWHENMWSLFRNIYYNNLTGLRKAYYMLNGIEMQYDVTSYAIVQDILDSLSSLSSLVWDSGTISGSGAYAQFNNGIPDSMYEKIAFYYNIFGFQRSLRYRDYFVGARTLPLAVGDVNVAVNSNLVNVVDVTKKIQMQRFLNQVNRVGRRVREYSAGIFGVAPKKDTDEVIFLSHVMFNVGAEETSNTGPQQLSMAQTTTSKLRKNGSNFIFDSDFTEFGVVLGVTYFDVTRPLVDGLDRTLLHKDRFEMFNPFMQNIGDQPVDALEIAPVSGGGYFGYKLRYSEYKQRTDRVAGGFKDYLPGFAFPTDINDLANPFSSTPLNLKISPDFIRSKPHEFDKFFNVLSTFSPAGYFHFIIRHDNEVTASRPMESAPSIL